jgi:hypothetical protein
MGVVDPQWSSQPERNVYEFLSEPGHVLQTRFHFVEEFLVRGGWPLVDRDRADMHRRVRPLQMEEQLVQQA